MSQEKFSILTQAAESPGLPDILATCESADLRRWLIALNELAMLDESTAEQAYAQFGVQLADLVAILDTCLVGNGESLSESGSAMGFDPKTLKDPTRPPTGPSNEMQTAGRASIAGDDQQKFVTAANNRYLRGGPTRNRLTKIQNAIQFILRSRNED